MNQTYNADCFEIFKQLDNESIDAIITDPPYLYLKHKLDACYNEELFIQECFRLLKPNGMLGFFGRGESFYKLNTLASNLGLKFKEEVIWDKKQLSTPTLPLGRCHETFAIYTKGKAVINKVKVNKITRDIEVDPNILVDDIKRILSSIRRLKTLEDLEDFKQYKYDVKVQKTKHKITNRTALSNADRGCKSYQSIIEGAMLNSIIRVSKEHYSYVHPTQKPIALMELLVKLITNENNLVLDPFAGSMSTLIACKNLNRRYIGIELDEEYYKVGVERLNNENK
jgi:site-specific DNA-methyltransferase (adenine-specific)